eukprot:GEMP01064769.1.p1 GENE.GEMP01064769.1~~GEMP01064769.1.p1  ORF type:complete len:349 (+),score=66.35 GEMP01064769.1:99-1145(+)
MGTNPAACCRGRLVPTRHSICLSPLPPRLPVRPEWKTVTKEFPFGRFRETFIQANNFGVCALVDAESPPSDPENAAAVCDIKRQLRICLLERHRVELKLEAMLVKASMDPKRKKRLAESMRQTAPSRRKPIPASARPRTCPAARRPTSSNVQEGVWSRRQTSVTSSPRKKKDIGPPRATIAPGSPKSNSIKSPNSRKRGTIPLFKRDDPPAENKSYLTKPKWVRINDSLKCAPSCRPKSRPARKTLRFEHWLAALHKLDDKDAPEQQRRDLALNRFRRAGRLVCMVLRLVHIMRVIHAESEVRQLMQPKRAGNTTVMGEKRVEVAKTRTAPNVVVDIQAESPKHAPHD